MNATWYLEVGCLLPRVLKPPGMVALGGGGGGANDDSPGLSASVMSTNGLTLMSGLLTCRMNTSRRCCVWPRGNGGGGGSSAKVIVVTPPLPLARRATGPVAAVAAFSALNGLFEGSAATG